MVVRVKVEIGTLVFNSVASVKRKKSIKNFTEILTIKIPKKLRFKSNGKPDSMYEPNKTARDYIKVKDKVTVCMGYDDQLIKRFEGYVSKNVEPSVPLVIECEDEMFLLKRKNVSVSQEKTSIKKIAEAIAPGYKIEVLDAEIGDFSYKNTTALKVLEELKKRFGLYSFFIGLGDEKTLVVGKPYTNSWVINQDTKTYDFSKNVIKSSLKYRSADDVDLKVKAISIQPDNTKLEVTVGDVNGAERTLHYFDLTEKELEINANRDLDRFKVDGYEGDIISFGFPLLEPGQKVTIVDNGYDKRNSTHYVEEIEEWIDKGYRLKSTIGKKVV